MNGELDWVSERKGRKTTEEMWGEKKRSRKKKRWDKEHGYRGKTQKSRSRRCKKLMQRWDDRKRKRI